ncbi:Hypothetical predicted protein [Paramuricea clavata]|uniref:Uncharacterized protein n=1 Tax=Paramuricea clavata TaxID=317549 RepID=A0A6S7J8A5_PARCT|nr:Hypothetical predicted protein [Paramuricea clavata]
MADASGLLGGFKLYVARKMMVTNKLTGTEIKVNGGTFYDGKDYGAAIRFGKQCHYYTLKRILLFERFEQISNNRIIIPLSNQTVKTEIPQFLLNIKNVADLDEKVKFIFERTPGYEGENFTLATGKPHRSKLQIILNVFSED